MALQKRERRLDGKKLERKIWSKDHMQTLKCDKTVKQRGITKMGGMKVWRGRKNKNLHEQKVEE
jgi:hypothetical protein